VRMTAPRTCVHFSLYLPQASRDARDDKGEGDASIWWDGSNDSLTNLVQTLPNLPQASQAAPNTRVPGSSAGLDIQSRRDE